MDGAMHNILKNSGTWSFLFKKSLGVITLGLAAALLVVVRSEVACAQAAAGQSAIEEVRKTIDQVIKINEQLSGEAKQKERRAKLREVIQPKFDFAEMSRRSLGAHWQNITPEQQDEFVKVFSDLLAHTYLARIESVKSGMVRVDSENLDFPRSVVKTTVENNSDKFPIDYKLMNTEGNWKIYDVVIENIGLVANYRNEFAGIIRKEEFSGLMQKLREKLAKQS